MEENSTVLELIYGQLKQVFMTWLASRARLINQNHAL